MAVDYPEVQGGGSLILAWQVKNKRVLVVGGGEVRLEIQHPPLPLLGYSGSSPTWQTSNIDITRSPPAASSTS